MILGNNYFNKERRKKVKAEYFINFLNHQFFAPHELLCSNFHLKSLLNLI